MNETKEAIRAFILREFLQGEPEDSLKDDTPLRTGGILDSMATLKLVDFVEETFGVELDAHDTGIENFDRIDDIAALVESKRRNEEGG